MLTVWKFPVRVADEFSIDMPTGAKLLTVQTQGGEPCLWALVEDADPKVARKLAIRGTGHNADSLDGAAYVGTFQVMGGALVFHLFDRGEAKHD